MKTPISIVFLLVVLVNPPATAAALAKKAPCGVERIIKNSDETFEVDFDSKYDRKPTLLKKTETMKVDIRSRQLLQRDQIIKATLKADEVLYLSDGKAEGCIVRVGEQAGKIGLYIERHQTIGGKPPLFENSFVEME